MRNKHIHEMRQTKQTSIKVNEYRSNSEKLATYGRQDDDKQSKQTTEHSQCYFRITNVLKVRIKKRIEIKIIPHNKMSSI